MHSCASRARRITSSSRSGSIPVRVRDERARPPRRAQQYREERILVQLEHEPGRPRSALLPGEEAVELIGEALAVRVVERGGTAGALPRPAQLVQVVAQRQALLD